MARQQDNTQPFTIRQAVEADLPVLVVFLAKLALHVAGEPPQELKTEEQDRLLTTLRASTADPNKLLLVAETVEAGLVGMGYIGVWHAQGIWEQAEEVVFKSAIIDDVWVEPDFRQMGIFSAILRELLAFAEKHAIEELILEYAVSNQEAATVWTGMGFEPTGVRAAANTSAVLDALNNKR